MHFAPEKCLTEDLRRRVGDGYLTADLAPAADLLLDITAIPLPDGSLDAIICSHVLEHIPDDALALSELFRVMKPGAWSVLETPVDLNLDKTDEDPGASPEERVRRFGQHDHVRLYGRDYPARLEAAGFSVEIVELAEALGPKRSRCHGLAAGKPVWVARKPSV